MLMREYLLKPYVQWYGVWGGELIGKALHKKYLRMTGNKIEDKGEKFFPAVQQINSALEKLDMGMQSVLAFGTVLTQNTIIKGINPNWYIENEPTVHPGYMLKENQCILKLGVSPCVI